VAQVGWPGPKRLPAAPAWFHHYLAGITLPAAGLKRPTAGPEAAWIADAAAHRLCGREGGGASMSDVEARRTCPPRRRGRAVAPVSRARTRAAAPRPPARTSPGRTPPPAPRRWRRPGGSRAGCRASPGSPSAARSARPRRPSTAAGGYAGPPACGSARRACPPAALPYRGHLTVCSKLHAKPRTPMDQGLAQTYACERAWGSTVAPGNPRCTNPFQNRVERQAPSESPLACDSEQIVR